MPTTASDIRWHELGAILRSSQKAPLPRTAVNRSPVAWFTTRAARNPSPSTAARLVAYQGSRREALVDPSTGSTTTCTSRSA
jgi:hypothetical protein